MEGLSKRFLSSIEKLNESLSSSEFLNEYGEFYLYSYGYIDETSLYIATEGKKSFKPGKISLKLIYI